MRKRWLSAASMAVVAVASAGCFHATVDTGATPSTETISKQWASGWIFGLVPPSDVETAAKCPHGIAKVETQRSFLNGLVGWLTLEIYTPMSIEVTCASGKTADGAGASADLTVSLEEGQAAVTAAFATAAAQVAATQRAVTVEVR